MYVSETNAETPAKLISFVMGEVAKKYDVDLENRRAFNNKKCKKNMDSSYIKTRIVCSYVLFEILQLRNFSRVAECLQYKTETHFKKSYMNCIERFRVDKTFHIEVCSIIDEVLEKSKYYPKYKNFIRYKLYEKSSD